MNPTGNPLDQLHPIVMPDHAISFWPLAPGWWALLVLLLGLIALMYLLRPHWQQRQKRRQIRANARQLLEALYIECAAQTDLPYALQHYLQQSNEIFKRLVHASTHVSANATLTETLTGKPWIEFIRKISATDKSSQAGYAFLYGENLYAATCTQTLNGKAIQLGNLHAWAVQAAATMAQEMVK